MSVQRPDELVAFAAQTAVLVCLGSFAKLAELPTAEGLVSSSGRVNYDALRRPTLRTLRGLDHALATGGHRTDLAGFATQVLATEGRFEVRWDVSGELFDELTGAGGSRTRSEALLRGACLSAWVESRRGARLGELLDRMVPGGADLPPTVGLTRRERANDLVEDLMAVVALPFGEGAQDAANLLARIPELALTRIRAHVLGEAQAARDGRSTARSPVGWTGVRCLTATLRYLSNPRSSIDAVHRDDLASEVADILREIDLQEERLSSFGRSSSLWEEAATELPPDAADTRWLIPALCDRAAGRPSAHGRRQLPVRERMTAAMVAYRRCSESYTRPVDPDDRVVLERLADDLDASSHAGDGHPEDELGLSFCAAQIAHLLAGGSLEPPLDISLPKQASTLNVAVSDGPLADRPEIERVAAFMRSTDLITCLDPVPRSSLPASARLVATAVLSPDALVQRTCLDTLVAAEIGDPAVRVFRRFADLLDASEEGSRFRWLEEHTTACVAHIASSPEDAAWLQRVAFSRGRERRQRAIRITAIMGLASLAPTLRRLDESLSTTIAERIAAALGDDPNPYDKAERRAATYALALLHPTTAPPGRTLLALAGSEDPITRDLAHWAMARRLAHEPGEAEEKGSERTRLVSPRGGWAEDVVATFRVTVEGRDARA